MKDELKKYFRTGIMLFILFLAVYYWKTFVGMVTLAYKAASPLIVGVAIAYVVNILMTFYEQRYFTKNQSPAVRKSARPVCMAGAFLTVIIILVLVLSLVIPELVSCIRLMFSEVPAALDSATDFLADWKFLPDALGKALSGIDWRSTIDKAVKMLTSGIDTTLSIAVGTVSTVAGKVVNLVVGSIFAIYLLLGKERLLSQLNRLLKNYLRPSWNNRLHYAAGVINDCFHKYIVGQCVEAVILGALCALGMLIFRFPYAVMTGTVIGVTALIPVAGAYIGGAVGFLLILSISPMKAVLFLVYLVVLQQLEGNLIYPRVVGASLGLPGIWVLAAVTVGGGIMGIGGMLLGVPLAAAAYQLLKNHVNKKEQLAV